jgi:hypothetical protein
VPEGGIDVIRHADDRQRDLRHGHDLAEGRDLQRPQGEQELVARGADRGRVRSAGVRVPRSPSERASAFILATNAASEPASQPASREAMLLPEGMSIASSA